MAALRLAQRLGGEPVLIPGQDVADSVIDYARANNVTHLIVGKSDRAPWRLLLMGSITHRLIKRAGGINIHVIEVPGRTTPTVRLTPRWRTSSRRLTRDLMRSRPRWSDWRFR